MGGKIRAGGAVRLKGYLIWLLFFIFTVCFGFESLASWDYNYTGGVQTWTCPTSALYKIEAWGAQGGNSSDTKGGYGGYSQGQIWINEGTTLYIVVGGQGSSVTTYSGGTRENISSGATGGFNGGGKGGSGSSDSNLGYKRYFAGGAGGGGATHIAVADYGVLKNYKDHQADILLAAGGGGGAGGSIAGGTGGGDNGAASVNTNNSVAGGTQNSGNAFGLGGNGGRGYTGGSYDNREGRGGGGGGWYGGYGALYKSGDATNCGGGGGSGHIGSGLNNASMQNGVKEGNGLARISPAHTHNTNAVHYTNSGQRIYNGHAQHYVHKWYSCDANDGYTKDNGEYYYEDCYDKDDNGSCDFCGRKRVWVNINVCTPEGNEDTSGGTAKFDVSWYDNLALGATQNHSATQVSDQPYGKVWVGTQIWLANINMQKSYLYLSGVSGASQSGNQYYYTVQDASHSININTAYKSYALTINPNGGTLNVSDSSITKNSDGTARATVTYNSGNYNILGITASRTHYIMDGFYTAASGGTKLWNNGGNCLNDGTYWKNNKWSYAGGVTAYAHWSDAPGYHNGQPIVYTITYNLFPKNGNGTKITDPGNPTTYTIETPTFTLKNPSATGYDFEGWYGSGTNGSKGVTIVQGSMGDLHFTADWLPTKDTSKSSSKDQNLPYVKTTPIIENTYRFAS